MLQEKEIEKLNKKKTKFYEKKIDRNSKDPEVPVREEKMKKQEMQILWKNTQTKHVSSICSRVQKMQEKKSTGQAAVRARLSGVRLDTEAEVNVMPK